MNENNLVENDVIETEVLVPETETEAKAGLKLDRTEVAFIAGAAAVVATAGYFMGDKVIKPVVKKGKAKATEWKEKAAEKKAEKKAKKEADKETTDNK